MSTKHDRMYARIQKHGEQLNAIFNTGIEPIALCKKLFKLENAQHRAATDYCNGTLSEQAFDAQITRTKKALAKILGDRPENPPIYINHDPRGYALKIDEAIMRERNLDLMKDWGGYGLIAPDLTGE